MNILVVGAGIGGLISTLALQSAGHDVTVLEQETAFKALPLAISLPKSSLAILAALNVEVKDALAIEHCATMDENGRPIKTPLVPAISVSRTKLHEAIISKFKKNTEVIFGSSIQRIRQLDSGVLATWGNATQEFDIVIGADGRNSAVRNRTLGPTTLQPANRTVWRGVADFDLGNTVHDIWGTAYRILLVPMDNGQCTYTISMKAKPHLEIPEWPEDFEAITSSYPAPWPMILANLPSSAPYRRDLYQLPKARWGEKQILLVGDAAHLTAPGLWQGAALAIEDGLAAAIAVKEDPKNPLIPYAAMRERRVTQFQNFATQLDKIHSKKLAAWWYRNARILPSLVSRNAEHVINDDGQELANRWLA